jgi:hypothetical protein
MPISQKGKGRGPIIIASAIAIVGLLAMLIVDHGPWARPKVQSPGEVKSTTDAAAKATDAAAKAAGATVAPTQPQSPLEPPTPGPKPAAPAIPAAR